MSSKIENGRPSRATHAAPKICVEKLLGPQLRIALNDSIFPIKYFIGRAIFSADSALAILYVLLDVGGWVQCLKTDE